ncbi:MAG: flagellar hook-length control protein FliK [Sphingomonadales bacterium]|nr:flagellar hook-length control protein FliK [Sphingomonadales bacterium]
MMGAALPQSPAQNGLLSILAATGAAAAPAGTTGEGGFEQLFANLPTAAVGAPVPATPLAANPFAVQLTAQPGTPAPVTAETPLAFDAAALPAPPATPTPPAAALFGMPQPVAEPTVDAEMAVELPAKAPAAPAAPVAATEKTDIDSAAAAASLLIAVATPLKGTTPAAEKAAPVDQTEADAPADDATPTQAVATPTQPVAQPAAAIVEAPAAAVVVATAMPAVDKPVADKTSKPAVAAPTARHADTTAAAAQPATAAKPEAVPSQAAMPLAAAEPKAAKPMADAGASMTVLFTQTAMQGAAPLAEAARAAPVAERTLDMTSDDQWIAQLAADIAATKSDKGDLSFRLMPRHLGRLDVAMSLDGDSVSLKLDTQHEATAAIVQAAQPRLVEDLRQQGVRVTEAQVTHTPVETGRQQQNQSQGRGTTPDASHLIETAADQADSTHDERTADRRGRFA